jgi:hypothetical protein
MKTKLHSLTRKQPDHQRSPQVLRPPLADSLVDAEAAAEGGQKGMRVGIDPVTLALVPKKNFPASFARHHLPIQEHLFFNNLRNIRTQRLLRKLRLDTSFRPCSVSYPCHLEIFLTRGAFKTTQSPIFLSAYLQVGDSFKHAILCHLLSHHESCNVSIGQSAACIKIPYTCISGTVCQKFHIQFCLFTKEQSK